MPVAVEQPHVLCRHIASKGFQISIGVHLQELVHPFLSRCHNLRLFNLHHLSPVLSVGVTNIAVFFQIALLTSLYSGENGYTSSEAQINTRGGNCHR